MLRTMPSEPRTDLAYIDRLRTVPSFADASLTELRAVAQVAEFSSVRAGAVLAGPCTPWRGVYVVAGGCVAVASTDDAAVAGPGTVVQVTGANTVVVTVSVATVVAIGAREWRALRALAPGIVATLESSAMPLAGRSCSAGGDVESSRQRRCAHVE
jgi:hypothetical protein